MFEQEPKQSLLPIAREQKKPMLAGLFSLILPGAGEFYTEHYWEAALFAGIEAAAITTALIYNAKGDDKTNEFQSLADKRWSVVKYAEWLNTYKQANVPISPNTALPPWERVNWDSLNFYEKDFSHKLPAHGDQQYYELIGKYPQYSPGWDDFNVNESDYHKLPAIFLSYSKMRGAANDYYNIAAKSVIAIYLNHILSAVNSIWGALSYNRALNVSGSMKTKTMYGFTDYEASIKLRYSF